jgi:hypothetical protein
MSTATATVETRPHCSFCNAAGADRTPLKGLLLCKSCNHEWQCGRASCPAIQTETSLMHRGIMMAEIATASPLAKALDKYAAIAAAEPRYIRRTRKPIVRKIRVSPHAYIDPPRPAEDWKAAAAALSRAIHV